MSKIMRLCSSLLFASQFLQLQLQLLISVWSVAVAGLEFIPYPEIFRVAEKKLADEMTDAEMAEFEETYDNYMQKYPEARDLPPLEDSKTKRSTCYIKVMSVDGYKLCAGQLFFYITQKAHSDYDSHNRTFGIITTADCFVPKHSTAKFGQHQNIKLDSSRKWYNFEGNIRFACNTNGGFSREKEIALRINAQQNLVRIHPASFSAAEQAAKMSFSNMALIVLPKECQSMVVAGSPEDTVLDYLKPFKHPITRAHRSNACKIVGYDKKGQLVQHALTRADQSLCHYMMPRATTRGLANKTAVCLEVAGESIAFLKQGRGADVAWGPTMCLLSRGKRWDTTAVGVQIFDPPAGAMKENDPRPLISSPLIENERFIDDALRAPVANFNGATCTDMLATVMQFYRTSKPGVPGGITTNAAANPTHLQNSASRKRTLFEEDVAPKRARIDETRNTYMELDPGHKQEVLDMMKAGNE